MPKPQDAPNGARPKIATTLQQTKQLQAVVTRFANELGTQGLALTNLTVKAKVGRSLSALVNAWGLLEESRLRLTKKGNPLFTPSRASEDDGDDDAIDHAAPNTFEEPIESSKESLSAQTVPTPTGGEGPTDRGIT